MPHFVENVVAMSYYSGTMPGTDGKDAHTGVSSFSVQ